VRRQHLITVSLTLLVAAIVSAQPLTLPDGVRTAADGISAEHLAWDLALLASDQLRGRNTPSPGYDAAAAYIAARLERAGLEPLGDNGGYFQHYDLIESHVDTANAAIEIAGQPWRFGDDFAMRSFARPVSGSFSVVYVGHGWTVPGSRIDPYAGVDVRGKLVLAHGPRVLPKGVEIKQIGRVTIGAESVFVEAARRGAAGVLFITQASELVRWGELKTANTIVRDLDPPVPSAYAALPVTSLLLAPHVTASIFDGEAMRGEDVIRRGEAGDFPPSFELKKSVTLRVPLASRFVHRPYNVVAVLRGGDERLRNQYITVEAHLDGAVGSRADNGDAVYNSADDNASGSVALLAIAERLMAAPRPNRSVIFIWDSGEEQGLWGTRRFVHAPPVPLDQIVAHVNVDMIGASRRPGSPDAASSGVTPAGEVFLIGPRVLSAQVDVLLQRVNEGYLKLGLNREHDRADSEFFYPRTDAGPFLERGILTIGFTTGIHDRYHRPADEARFLDPVQMREIARTVLASVWAMADAAERPRIDRPMPPSVPKWP
jgi:Zn-dependent M28 family amino/carboxypeptidase